MKIFSKTLAPLIFALPLAAQTSAKENTLSGLPPCPQGTPSKNWTNCDGKVRYPSGATYEGAYIDGKHNGKGKYVTPDGVTYEGNHRDNKRNGRFLITYADGKKREATYEDNQLKSDQDLNRPQDRLASNKAVPAPATRAGDEKQSERKPMMEDRRLTAEANQSTPSIKEGVDYRKARQALIDAGWEPVPQTESTSFFGEEIRRTYREVKDCAGTGKAPCIFVFKGKNGRTLHVHTTGEDPKFVRLNLELTPIAERTTSNAQSYSSNTIQDVKTVLSQCSARYVFTVGLINSGVITYPANMAQQVIARYGETSRNLMAIANRLPGASAQQQAEQFFELLKRTHNSRNQNSSNPSAVSKQAMDEAFSAIDKCVAYTGNPAVQNLTRGY